MTEMQKYNKAIGGVVGGLLALAGIWGLNVNLEPEQIAGIVTALSVIGTFFSPKNKE